MYETSPPSASFVGRSPRKRGDIESEMSPRKRGPPERSDGEEGVPETLFDLR